MWWRLFFFFFKRNFQYKKKFHSIWMVWHLYWDDHMSILTSLKQLQCFVTFLIGWPWDLPSTSLKPIKMEECTTWNNKRTDILRYCRKIFAEEEEKNKKKTMRNWFPAFTVISRGNFYKRVGCDLFLLLFFSFLSRNGYKIVIHMTTHQLRK